MAKVAIQPGGGCGVHNPAELLFSEDGPNGLGAREGALEVHGLDLVPFGVRHIPETVGPWARKPA